MFNTIKYCIRYFSKLVGCDALGNRYYQSGKKRYVIYRGVDEASKVPPLYNAWLRGMLDDFPHQQKDASGKWMNFTGTKRANKFDGIEIKRQRFIWDGKKYE